MVANTTPGSLRMFLARNDRTGHHSSAPSCLFRETVNILWLMWLMDISTYPTQSASFQRLLQTGLQMCSRYWSVSRNSRERTAALAATPMRPKFVVKWRISVMPRAATTAAMSAGVVAPPGAVGVMLIESRPSRRWSGQRSPTRVEGSWPFTQRHGPSGTADTHRDQAPQVLQLPVAGVGAVRGDLLVQAGYEN